MPAYDTSLDPVGLTPNNTLEQEVTAAEAVGNESWLLGASVIGSTAVSVRMGITPASGTPTLWVLYDDTIQAGTPLVAMGPFPVKAGCKLIVRTASANNVAFLRTGYIDS